MAKVVTGPESSTRTYHVSLHHFARRLSVADHLGHLSHLTLDGMIGFFEKREGVSVSSPSKRRIKMGSEGSRSRWSGRSEGSEGSGLMC